MDLKCEIPEPKRSDYLNISIIFIQVQLVKVNLFSHVL